VDVLRNGTKDVLLGLIAATCVETPGIPEGFDTTPSLLIPDCILLLFGYGDSGISGGSGRNKSSRELISSGELPISDSLLVVGDGLLDLMTL